MMNGKDLCFLICFKNQLFLKVFAKKCSVILIQEKKALLNAVKSFVCVNNRNLSVLSQRAVIMNMGKNVEEDKQASSSQLLIVLSLQVCLTTKKNIIIKKMKNKNNCLLI